MANTQNFTDTEITKLQFITHRLAIFSSPDVLNEYNNFLKTMEEISTDGSFTNDKEKLLSALGKLTVQIRADLLSDNKNAKTYTQKQIVNMIKNNSNRSSKILYKKVEATAYKPLQISCFPRFPTHLSD